MDRGGTLYSEVGGFYMVSSREEAGIIYDGFLELLCRKQVVGGTVEAGCMCEALLGSMAIWMTQTSLSLRISWRDRKGKGCLQCAVIGRAAPWP